MFWKDPKIFPLCFGCYQLHLLSLLQVPILHDLLNAFYGNHTDVHLAYCVCLGSNFIINSLIHHFPNIVEKHGSTEIGL